MSFKSPSQCHIGEYDRMKVAVVTQPDGSQQMYSKVTKYGFGKLAPLDWWRKCGFTADERDAWAKCVLHPELAQLLQYAGITPEELWHSKVTASELDKVLMWFNIYRTVYGHAPKNMRIFNAFVLSIKHSASTGSTVCNTAHPLSVGYYIRHLSETNVSTSDFTFLVGNDKWVDAVRTHLGDAPIQPHTHRTVKALMQVGADTSAIPVITVPTRSNSLDFNQSAENAVKMMFMAGESSATKESYMLTRMLADMLDRMASSYEDIKELFFDSNVDRGKMYSLVCETGVSDALRLRAILQENTPVAIADGFL